MKALSLPAAATLVLAPSLWAKDEDRHADLKHGSVTAEAGMYHLELVAKDKGNVALTPAGGNVVKCEAERGWHCDYICVGLSTE